MVRLSTGLLLLLAISLSLGAMSKRSLPNLPHSPNAAFRSEQDAERLPLKQPSPYVAPISQTFTCSPAPCVLPNVDVSPSPMPVNETPIVANPANPQQLLAGANDYSCRNLGGFYTSNDGGTTWTRTCINTPPFVNAEGDPGVGYDLNGNAYITSLAYGNMAGVVFEKSADNGQTWGAPQNAVTLILNGLVDKDWLQIDTNPTSPYANTLYICATQKDPHDSLISVSHSNDGGQTWTTVAAEPAQRYPVYDGSC